MNKLCGSSACFILYDNPLFLKIIYNYQILDNIATNYQFFTSLLKQINLFVHLQSKKNQKKLTVLLLNMFTEYDMKLSCVQNP